MGLYLCDHLGHNYDLLSAELAEADIIVLHWWNHPQLYDWLINGRWPSARLLIWSHVSGRCAPQVITRTLAEFADTFACSTPISLKLPALKGLQPRLLFSSAGVGDFLAIQPTPHEEFRVGYLGTVDYAKMHPDFISMCLAAQLPPESRFVVAGGPDHDRLRREVEVLGLADRFEILGPITNVAAFLAETDVFAYPLNPEHYGTGEQALIETLAAGIPAVVLSGGAEAFVVEDGISGLIAMDESAFSQALRRLYEDSALRRKLGEGAKSRAEARFGIERTADAFESLYSELIKRPKRKRHWSGGENFSPWEIFLTSQGELGPLYKKILAEGPGSVRDAVWPRASFSTTRGSVFHYRDFFPHDEELRRCAALMEHVIPE